MSEQFTKNEDVQVEVQESQIAEDILTQDDSVQNGDSAEAPTVPKKRITKKQLLICGVIAVALIVIALVIFIPSKFERVKNEAVEIAGMVSGSGDYFVIDTYPDIYEDMDSMLRSLLLPGVQEKALEAIKYVNKELGFDGSVYSLMMETTALMGRQTEENDKYKVTWNYHPDDGLEVTYRKK